MPPSTAKIKLAVVTGGHPYDNIFAFHDLFRSFTDVDAYIQHMEDFTNDWGNIRSRYDVALFFNMHLKMPPDEGNWYENNTRKGLSTLGETPQGIFMLHHSILAYPEYQPWSEICGIQNRAFGYHVNQEVDYRIADPAHPITRGLAPFHMTDETNTMADPTDSRVLITADHPKSMKNIAWTRQYRKSPVFCFQCGHDRQAYENANFRTIVHRGIQWLAGRL